MGEFSIVEYEAHKMVTYLKDYGIIPDQNSSMKVAMIARLTVLALLLFCIPLALSAAAGEIGVLQKSGIRHVTATEADRLISLKSEMIILDIRTASEFSQGHIQGAINIDFYARNFKDLMAKLDPTKEYLVYCRSGRRSTSALPTLQSAGLRRLIHMNKGLKTWKSPGLKLVQK